MSGAGPVRHPDFPALSRFAERGGEGDEAEEVRAHLRACSPCRSVVAEIRALRRRASELPSEIQPPRDLWPEVEARVRAEPREPTGAGELAGAGASASTHGRDDADGRPLTLRRAAPWLAAAAAVLMAVTAGATLWLADGPASTSSDAPVAAADAPAAAFGEGGARPVGLVEVREGYAPAVERLSALLEARGDRLAPETRDVLERNLGIIDAAIAEAESALVDDPSSAERVRALERSYQRKVEMLRRSVRLTSQL